MKKKLNPAKIARIRERRATGETLESLAREFKLSIGTVSNALKAPTGPAAPARKPKAPSKPSPPADEGELPTPDDLRRSIAAQVADLQADVAAAETPAARATASRLLVSALQLQSRVTPPDLTVAPPGMVLVDTEEMKKLAELGRTRLGALLRDMFAAEPK